MQQSAFEHIFPDLPLSGSTGQGVEVVGLAHTLAELAWNPDRQTPFAVVLPGGWGRDKTSLLRQTRHLLDGPQSQGGARKVCTRRFNTWKFPDEDSVLVGLLGALLNEFRQGSRLDQLRFQIDSQNTQLARLLLHAASPPRDVTAGDFERQDKPWKSPVGLVFPGIEWVKIPAGTFNMGSARGRDNEQPVHVVTLPGFHIAQYPVTNAQYAHYVTATGAPPPQHWRNGKIPEGRENHPVVYVSWREAVDFCDWLSEIVAEQGQSGRVQLPSETEWEYAARGIEGRTYPWGNNAPDKGYCNFDNAVSDTTPVGAYPKGATPDGVHDLAGNVWEWTRSKWENYPYPRDEKGRDKREERSGDNRRTLRGCSFRYSAWFTRSACRGNAHPGGRHPRIGFRVVVSPAPSLHDAAPDL